MATTSLRERFGYRVSLLTRRWRAVVDAELEAYGLSQATWRPLIYVSSFDEPPRQCDLADALSIGGPALVRLLDQLETRGLVERFVDGDRRANKVRLTRAGKRLAARVYEIIHEIERDLLQDISAAELARVSRALEAIDRRIDRRTDTEPKPAKRSA